MFIYMNGDSNEIDFRLNRKYLWFSHALNLLISKRRITTGYEIVVSSTIFSEMLVHFINQCHIGNVGNLFTMKFIFWNVQRCLAIASIHGNFMQARQRSHSTLNSTQQVQIIHTHRCYLFGEFVHYIYWYDLVPQFFSLKQTVLENREIPTYFAFD